MRLLFFLLTLPLLSSAAEILIVADEIPAMQLLATKLPKACDIVEQEKMPSNISTYADVIVYIHGDISDRTEHALIDYAKRGGRLILLHHTISSAKRKNKDWLPFLGVVLPEGTFESGGYKYIDPADFAVVKLGSGSPVTKGVSTIEFKDTEIYLNHVLDGKQTPLLGVKFTDPKSGRSYEQKTAAWYRKTDKGDVYYFMVGHHGRDFEAPGYSAMIARTVK